MCKVCDKDDDDDSKVLNVVDEKRNTFWEKNKRKETGRPRMRTRVEKVIHQEETVGNGCLLLFSDSRRKWWCGIERKGPPKEKENRSDAD